MNRCVTLMAAVVLLAVPLFAQDQTTMEKDRAAVREAALNYIEGWYTADGARMEKALHPDLAKRGIWLNPEDGKTVIRPVTAEALVDYTRKRTGKTPKDQWGIEVTIFDMLENSATVKVVSADFIDYLHVAKVDGEWKILNVLWEPARKKPKQ